MASQIPLTNEPAQLFSISLGGSVYDVEVKYNTRQAVWMLNLSTTDFVVDGIALLSGVNLLQQYPSFIDYLILINISETADDPTANNLQDEFVLVVISDEEFGEI